MSIAAAADDRGCTLGEWRRTIERDRVPQPRPVALAFFLAESFREFLATLSPDDGDLVAVVAEPANSPADELRFA